MKKELLTGLTAATVALTAGARPCGPGFGGHHHFGGPHHFGGHHHFHGGWGHGGRYGWPAVGAGLVAGAWAARAYSDAYWASRAYYNYGYTYGVAAPVVYQSTPVVYQQPVQQVVYQQPAQQVVYQQPAPQVIQQAPQPQEVKIVVEHQYPAQTAVQSNQAQQQRAQ